MNKKVNRSNIVEHLLSYQLELIGKKIEDLDEEGAWLKELSTSQENYEKFRVYAIPLLKKIFKFNTNRAKSTFAWFDLMWGLKIEQNE